MLDEIQTTLVGTNQCRFQGKQSSVTQIESTQFTYEANLTALAASVSPLLPTRVQCGPQAQVLAKASPKFSQLIQTFSRKEDLIRRKR